MCVSESVRDALPRHAKHRRGHQSPVIHNGIELPDRRPSDKDREEPRQTFGIPTNAVTLGFVGRLSEQKDHKALLRALRILTDRGLESFPIIVETGPSERELKNLAAELIFTGCALLNACRVR